MNKYLRKPLPNVYFSDAEKLRKLITEWDPISKEKGTIDSFAKRLQNKQNSQDWKALSPIDCAMEKLRRKQYRLMSLSKRTLERALKGHNVAEVTADIIASELGVSPDDLGVTHVKSTPELGLPQVRHIGTVMEFTKQTVFDWLTQGEDVGFQDLPAHPELVYRLSKEWQGWNVFLDIEENTPEADMHNRIDALEEEIFELIGMIMYLISQKKQKPVED